MLANAIRAINNQIEIEKKNATADDPINGTEVINKIKIQFEALELDSEQLKTLNSAVIENLGVLAKNSSNMYLSCDFVFQAHCENVDAFDRSDGTVEDIKASQEAEEHFQNAISGRASDRDNFNTNIDSLVNSLNDLKSATSEKIYPVDSSPSF